MRTDELKTLARIDKRAVGSTPARAVESHPGFRPYVAQQYLCSFTKRLP